MKYQAKVTGLGPDALAFIEGGSDFIIIFNEDAPPELAEISVLHTKAELKENPVKGDKLKIGSKEFTINEVGNEAAYTLKTLGHCTLDFSGNKDAFRPGCIMLEGNKLLAEDIKPGCIIEIF